MDLLLKSNFKRTKYCWTIYIFLWLKIKANCGTDAAIVSSTQLLNWIDLISKSTADILTYLIRNC